MICCLFPPSTKIFGEDQVTSGAYSDLDSATSTARSKFFSLFSDEYYTCFR